MNQAQPGVARTLRSATGPRMICAWTTDPHPTLGPRALARRAKPESTHNAAIANKPTNDSGE